jgi:hypothetical protein
MIPSRKLAAMFLCVFGLGAVAGALLEINFGDPQFSTFLNKTSDPAALAQRVDKRLASQFHLDADEQTRIAPITKEMAQNLFDLRHKFALDVLATIDTEHGKIAAQMTPAQRDAYLKDIATRRARAVAVLMPPTANGTPAQP